MSKVGEGSAEHPQNVNLSSIIDINEKIKRILVESSREDGDAAFGEIRDADDEGATNLSEAPVVVSNAQQTGLSRIVTLWIDLQNATNCYLDSAKNPNPLATSDVPGIRQILERKEGLFRKHMMGKRVNYCCRSVISPDPYIGTNEVGIPALFAKTLHYPTAVSDWNVKHLRKLVENGPAVYPGDEHSDL
jgi:DNA-directed RNA polymerase I subunit RPA1